MGQYCASLWEEYRTFQEGMFKNGQNVISIAIRKYQTATQTWQGLCWSNEEPWIKDDPKQASPLKQTSDKTTWKRFWSLVKLRWA